MASDSELLERAIGPVGAAQPDTIWPRFLEVVPAILWTADADGRLTILSEAGAAWLGVPCRLETASGYLDLIHPDEREDFAAQVREARLAGELLDAERRTRIADGSYRWMRIRARHDPVSGIWHGASEDIHERREAELALRVAHERLALALDGGRVWAWDLNAVSGRFWYSNRQPTTLGYATGEINADISDLDRLVHPDDRQRVSRALRAHLAGHTDTYECEYRVQRKDGSWAWVSDRGRAIERDRDGKATRVIGARTDISTQKGVEAHLQTLLDNIVEGVVAVTPDGKCAFYNQAYSRLFLQGHDGLPWRDIGELFALYEVTDASGRVYPDAERPIARILRGETIRNLEVISQMRGTDRQYRLIYNGQPVRGADGSVELAVLTIRDITEQRQAQEALLESEARFRGVFESGVVGMAIVDYRAGVTYAVNDRLIEIAGTSHEAFEAGNRDWQAVMPPECLPNEQVIAEIRANGYFRPFEKAFQRKDGSQVHVRLSSAPLPNRPGQIALCVEDVSERKTVEQALAASEERLRAIVESLEEGVVAYAPGVPDGFVNSAFRRMFGLRDTDRISLSVMQEVILSYDLLDTDGRVLTPDERPIMRVLRGEHLDRLAARARFTDGRWLDVVYHGAPIFGEDGTVKLAVIAVRDVTERNKARADLATAQQELIHVSRVSAVGTMAGSLAHELNQPLAAIANYAAAARMMLASESQPIERIREALQQAASEALRAGQIVHRLRRFIAKGEVQRRAESLTSIVREALAIAHSDAAARGTHTKLKLAANADAVIADRIQLQQVVFNLVRNAVEAMVDGPDQELTIVSRGAGDRVELLIADRGPGLPPEVQAHLFEPFVTTKASGMGIGLSICRSIMRAHGGDIRAEPRPTGGTVFILTLPRANTFPVE